MTNSSRVAVTQMNSVPDMDRNLDSVERLVLRAVREGAEVVMFPEGFAYMGPEESKVPFAEPLPQGGRVLQTCANLAKQHSLHLVMGGYWERGADAKKVINACVHLDPQGVVQKVYRKIHLFDVDLSDGTKLQESAGVIPGKTPVVTSLPFGLLGLSICYDLRFPELYRKLVDLGAVGLAVPSAFTLTTGKDHWHALLRARAIESQCYVFAPAQTGLHYGTRGSYGHALICDPWGAVIAECSEGESCVVVTVEPERVERIRRALPSLKHRVL